VAPIPHVALVFPGQGTQFTGMGRDVYDAFPAARAVFDLADDVLGFPMSRLCFEGPDDELRDTVNAQPAVVTLSLALLTVVQLSRRPIVAKLTAGHSLGEYSAFFAAGAVTAADVILLARRRGEFMQSAQAKNPGAMSAVIGLDAMSLGDICRETGVFIANYNSPDQTIISGNIFGVEAAGRLAVERGARKVIPLQVSGAFHTSLMSSAAQELAAAIDQAVLTTPRCPIIANTTATPLDSAAALKKELSEQLTHPVRWQESIETMVALGVNTIVELGPGKVLAGLIKRINPTVRAISLSDAATISKYIVEGFPS